MKTFYVATYWHPETPKLFTAYLRVFNPEWDGFVGYSIDAKNGAEAKRKAIAMRKESVKKREEQALDALIVAAVRFPEAEL